MAANLQIVIDELKARRRIYSQNDYRKHRERILARGRKWRADNRAAYNQQALENHRKNRSRNLARMRAYNRKYWLIRREEILAKRKSNRHLKRAYHQRMKADPSYRLRRNLQTRIRMALLRNSKHGSTMALVGCSIESLWIYFESRFEEGMTRENYGKVWHVDHIIPCAIFDLTKLDHQRRCFHFSNLQPLFAIDNLRKHAKSEVTWLRT